MVVAILFLTGEKGDEEAVEEIIFYVLAVFLFLRDCVQRIRNFKTIPREIPRDFRGIGHASPSIASHIDDQVTNVIFPDRLKRPLEKLLQAITSSKRIKIHHRDVRGCIYFKQPY